MEPIPAASEAAHRLGLTVDGLGKSTVTVARRGIEVSLDGSRLQALGETLQALFALSWLLFGIRIGIDKRLGPSREQSQKPDALRYRRTSLRRYHEAPSVHGDHLLLLVPRAARRIFEIIAQTRAFRQSWMVDGLEQLVLHETGLCLDILTEDEQAASDLSEANRWEKARAALFYQSYKVRPRQTLDVPGGTLRILETGEGFGASRILLLPEYDYDASRDHGFAAVPTRDQIIIARPHHRSVADQMLPALRRQIDQALNASPFGMTDAILGLKSEELVLAHPGTFQIEETVDIENLVLHISTA